jgi:hypothetical protein
LCRYFLTDHHNQVLPQRFDQEAPRSKSDCSDLFFGASSRDTYGELRSGPGDPTTGRVFPYAGAPPLPPEPPPAQAYVHTHLNR